jgi:hypothetical protein
VTTEDIAWHKRICAYLLSASSPVTLTSSSQQASHKTLGHLRSGGRALISRMMELQRHEASRDDCLEMLPTLGYRTYAVFIRSIAFRRVQHVRSTIGCILIFGLLLLTACGRATQVSKSVSPSGEWRQFQGTWIAAGNRNSMRLDGERIASISTYNGSLVLYGPARPGVGFHCEAIVLNDSSTGLVGRAVWTDEHGDKAYSELRGEGTAQQNKIMGTFFGGTGRYLGATGTYEFSWRFLIENEDGVVQGQSAGLSGRVRVDSQQAASRQGATHSWAERQ